MRRAQMIQLSAAARRTLGRWSRDSSHTRRARRARMLLLAAQGWSNEYIAESLGTDVHTVARWRLRFLKGGLPAVDGERERPGRPRLHSEADEARILAITRNRRPSSGRRWTTRSLAAHLGVSHSRVQRIWTRARITPPTWPPSD